MPITVSDVVSNPLTKFLLAAVNPLLAVVPEIAKIFMDKGTPVPERNVAAAVRLVETAQKALQARGIDAGNAQAVAEAVQASPEARQVVRDAVLADPYWHMVEAGGGGIDGARKADAAFAAVPGANLLRSPAFLVTVVLLSMPTMLLIDLFFVNPSLYKEPLRTQIITAVLAVIMLVGGYWLGTSASSARKTEIDAAKTP